jgi:hypothetical protein
VAVRKHARTACSSTLADSLCCILLIVLLVSEHSIVAGAMKHTVPCVGFVIQEAEKEGHMKVNNGHVQRIDVLMFKCMSFDL